MKVLHALLLFVSYSPLTWCGYYGLPSWYRLPATAQYSPLTRAQLQAYQRSYALAALVAAVVVYPCLYNAYIYQRSYDHSRNLKKPPAAYTYEWSKRLNTMKSHVDRDQWLQYARWALLFSGLCMSLYVTTEAAIYLVPPCP